MHRVHQPELRANVVQSEFARLGYRDVYMPYIVDAVDSLPGTARALIEQGRPVEAEHILRSFERMTGVIDHAQFQKFMKEAIDRDAGDPSYL